ncbi:unnamed protein product [Lepeophtheirus salmonis]|uniref:(salmon louse) hypothetical protein n=1 Tax=Lepeophtheirus salmonis TaxID=72036 RepID=A0A7R8CUG7_LEPSM|nr:unnamed protein product [Lepeophtheirus salmonis]CAF2936551.1 unnamed protein product [Lepeophtheirus salmonis]
MRREICFSEKFPHKYFQLRPDKSIESDLKISLRDKRLSNLISHGYPLPSKWTLQRNLKRIGFQSGILHTLMSLLQLKSQTMEDSNKYYGIMMDEMWIKSTIEYDVGDQLVIGYDTLKPSSDELATHALVFALVGVKTR